VAWEYPTPLFFVRVCDFLEFRSRKAHFHNLPFPARNCACLLQVRANSKVVILVIER
jgi:hypothetical protein